MSRGWCGGFFDRLGFRSGLFTAAFCRFNHCHQIIGSHLTASLYFHFFDYAANGGGNIHGRFIAFQENQSIAFGNGVAR